MYSRIISFITCKRIGHILRTTTLVLFASAVSIHAAHANSVKQLVSNASQVNFISIKNEHIAESHSFEKVSGNVTTSGMLTIEIDLSSVNTLIPIRNERMQAVLFNVTDFATATFTAQIDPTLLSMPEGGKAYASVTGQLTISGKSVATTFDISVISLSGGQVMATTTKPTLLSTTAFGLDGGVDALKSLAMLNSISKTVPLTFSVVFE